VEQHGMYVERIWGASRYETSREVVRHLVDTFGVNALAYEPFIARGDNFADALAASPFAWEHVRPVILVRPSSAPQAALDAIEMLETDSVVVLGGVGAVSDEVILDIAEAQPNDTVYYHRVAGANRYDTAASVARFWERPYDAIGLSSGTNFPDALAGGPMVGRLGGALLLTPPTSLAPEARGVLGENGIYLWHLRLLGGEGALSRTVMGEASSAVGTSAYDMNYLSGVSGTSIMGLFEALDQAAITNTDPDIATLKRVTSEGETKDTDRTLQPIPSRSRTD
ncbi:MAG: cell wall-binding repeat-containing protein, partial [Actinomycetota bacterium]|jgi:hypothetical protein|nr:cell wall-binding repeat-containing protein [Actinomycetota bacterium]